MIRSLLLLLMLVVTAARAEAPADFAYGIPLLPQGQGPFAQLSLPAAVYEGVAERGLADLRVFNAEGAMVPFALVSPPLPLRERTPPVPLTMFPLRTTQDVKDIASLVLSINQTAAGTAINLSTRDGQPASGDRLVGYVLDTTAIDEPLTALNFVIPDNAPTTTMRLSIEASDDLANWRMLAPKATLVTLEYAGHRLTRDRIEFAPTKAKYLRASWVPTEPSIAFSAVTGDRGDRTIDADRQWRQVKGRAVAGKEGEYAYDVGGIFPIDRMALELADINSIVPAQLLVRSVPGDEWLPLLATVFYRLGEAAGEVTSPPVTVATGEWRHWVVRIDPRSGGAGKEPPTLRIGWQPTILVFAVRGNGPFTLAFGKHRAKPGELPITTLMPGYDPRKGIPSSVGVAQVRARGELGGPSRLEQPLDTRRWLLWATLVLAAALLGWMAYRLSRQIGSAAATSSKAGASSAEAANPPAGGSRDAASE